MSDASHLCGVNDTCAGDIAETSHSTFHAGIHRRERLLKIKKKEQAQRCCATGSLQATELQDLLLGFSGQNKKITAQTIDCKRLRKACLIKYVTRPAQLFWPR